MASKVSLKSNSVAYFDDPDLVPAAGFYIVEKEAAENDGEIQLGKQVFPSPDGDGFLHDEPADDYEEGGDE